MGGKRPRPSRPLGVTAWSILRVVRGTGGYEGPVSALAARVRQSERRVWLATTELMRRDLLAGGAAGEGAVRLLVTPQGFSRRSR